jgi:hypothetical protein
MKKLRISLTATMAILLLVLITSGFAAAQATDESFVKGIMVKSDPNDDVINAGDTVQVAIFYHNNSTETVTLLYAGVHFDWMPTDSLYGFNTSSYNIQVASGHDYFFQQQISIKIPTNANGVHTYYVGIEGVTASSAAISLSSDPPVEFMVTGTGATVAPTNTNSGTNNPGAVPDIVFYGAIVAVVAIVVVLLVLVLMRRKRRPSSKPAEPAASQPPAKPEETPSSQDFAI